MLLLDDPRRKFLEEFHPNKRSTVSGEFLTVIRAGEKDPGKIVNSVLQRTLPSSKYNPKGYIAQVIQQNMHLAYDFAEHCIAYENLPAIEKETIKQARKKEAIKANVMLNQPATDKQIKYLQFLGYIGPTPTNKAEASDLIDHILKYNNSY